ncbi:MAG: hypothetical protein U0441_16435 [Polyangiaceae bacterium]
MEKEPEAPKASSTIPLKDAASKASGTIPLADAPAPDAAPKLEVAATPEAAGPPKVSDTIPLNDPSRRGSSTIPLAEAAPPSVEIQITEDAPPVAETENAPPVVIADSTAPDNASLASSAAPDKAPLADSRAPDKAPPPEAPRPTVPDPEPPKVPSRWGKWLLRGALAIVGVLGAAALAIVIFGPGYARGRILEEAQARGVVLAFGDVDLGWTKIRLHDARVALSGVQDFEAAASSIDVDIADGQPRSIVAHDLSITLTGTEVLTDLGAWKNAHAAALAAPFSAEGAHVEWHPSSGAAAALSLDDAKVSVDPQKGSIDAGATKFIGRDAGPVTLAWSAPAEGFVVDIQPLEAPLSAAHIQVRGAKDGPRVKLTLARTALGPLQSALGIPKGSEGLQADGEVEMPVPSLAKPAPVTGTLRLAVKGYTPPHPRELDGILFGDTTTVKSKFEVAADLGSAKLTDLTAEAGALSLSGGGELTREGLDARVQLKLKGSIPCSSLATSAAVSRLGSGLGRLAGGLAAGALTGNVGVSISVDARASDVKGAKITQSARIGCKVSIPGVGSIVFKSK